MSPDPVVALLGERLGLAPDALGSGVLAAVIARRVQALGLPGSAEYAERLRVHTAELQALADEVSVPETWFFRGGQPFFTYLADWARGVMSQGRPFRALSVPCASGEEPLSLAITLAEQGALDGWSIDGVDVSARAVARARRGRYPALAFRQTSDPTRARWFKPVGAEWEADPGVRSRVRYQVGNLLDPLFLAGEPPYDLVFCRNLFIYLHAEARRRALATLDRLVRPDGLLAMGHAESLDDPRFARHGAEGFFLHRHSSVPASVPALASLSPPVQVRVPEGEARPLRVETVVTVPSPPGDPLEAARRLADSGRTAEALALCRGLAPSADLFALLGELHAGIDPVEAARCFERALYLAPDHPGALLHLMLMRAGQGEHDKADRLRLRLERGARATKGSPGGEA